MTIKSLANRVTSKVGRQMLIAQHHSPTILFTAGAVGMFAFGALTIRATLKLSETLDEGEENLKHVEVTVIEGEEETKKASFNVRLQTAIRITKLYAPAAAVGVVSVAAMTGSHVILRRRNFALTAAYAIVQKGFDEYRGRVIEDQGPEKDLEYRFGTEEREIVEEGPNGIERRTVKGLNQQAIKDAESRSYARVFDRTNDNFSELPHQNQYFVQMVQNHASDALRVNGYIFLNDVYDMLGFKRTAAGQVVGWVSTPKFNDQGEQINDCYVDFGVWNEGVYKGKEWVNGDPKAFLLDFNVDGNVLDILQEV